MYALSVRFMLPADTDWDAIRQLARDRAPLYEQLPGLVAKAFVLDPDTREYGGNYVWDSSEAIDAFLDSDLFRGVVEQVGEPAEVRRYEVPAYLERSTAAAPSA
jgi:heme-degrading monooxygenase HmoA